MNTPFERPKLPHPILRWLIGIVILIVMLACGMDGVELPQYGVTKLCQYATIIYAYSYENNWSHRPADNAYSYRSADGGQTWSAPILARNGAPCGSMPTSTRGNEFTLTDNTHTYRIVANEGIYLTESGQPERLDFDLSMLRHDAYRVYHTQSTFEVLPPNRAYIAGVWDGLVDLNTGNIVLAMGWNGILLKADGEWRWVAVGDDYYFPSQARFDKLMRPYILAFMTLLGVLPSSIILWRRRLSGGTITATIVGWLIQIPVVILTVYLIETPTPFDVFHVIVLGVHFGLGLLAWKTITSIERKYNITALFTLIGLSLTVAMLFLMPFLLWVRQIIPSQLTATSFALLLLGGGQMTAAQIFAWYFPPPKKPKKKKQEVESYFEA